MLRFEKIDYDYYKQYKEMLEEWQGSNTSLTPDILRLPCNDEIDYKNIINTAQNAEMGIHNEKEWYERCKYYLIVNDQNKLIGATAIRQNLTQLGKDTWGNIAYGIRPSERRKGYAKAVANMLINKCKELGMNEIIACHYIENDASKRVLESAGAIPTGVLVSEYSGKKIKRYIIRTKVKSEINFSMAKQVFNDYIKQFDSEDGSILLKITHTYQVVNLSEYIAKEQGLDEEGINLAKLIALLHDIGRFKQVTVQRSFSDKTFDHADYGNKILFEEKLIRDFIKTEQYDEIIRKAIYNHNKYKIEDGLNELEELQCKIIRDADKLDNFRVKDENKFEDSFPGRKMKDFEYSKELLAEESTFSSDKCIESKFKYYQHESKQKNNIMEELENSSISDKVYNDFLSHKCIQISDRKTLLDYWICVLAFIFDLYFKSSLKYIYDKNYIDILIDKIDYKNEETKERMEFIRKCAKEYLEDKIR